MLHLYNIGPLGMVKQNYKKHQAAGGSLCAQCDTSQVEISLLLQQREINKERQQCYSTGRTSLSEPVLSTERVSLPSTLDPLLAAFTKG